MLGVKRRLRRYVTGDETKRVRDHLREKSRKPHNAKLLDKISFTIGVLNISICQYFVCSLPRSFWLWYSLVIPVLLYSRMAHFKPKGWHYFLLDFCYFTLFCSFLHLYAFPQSALLFRVFFVYANGPLAWAIVLWRNSFVFHDYDKITSVYIHLLPSILTFTEKWFKDPLPDSHPSLATSDYLAATLGYVFWQLGYYLKTEFMDKTKLDLNPNLLTSLRWMSRDEKNFAAKKVLTLCRAVGLFQRKEKYDPTTLKTKAVFMTTQLVYTLLTFVPTYFLYLCRELHAAFICLIMTVSIFYGASYYIEIFAERYHLQFQDEQSVRDFAHSAVADALDSMQPDKGERYENRPVVNASPLLLVQEAANELANSMLSAMRDGMGTPESCD